MIKLLKPNLSSQNYMFYYFKKKSTDTITVTSNSVRRVLTTD